MTRRASQDQFSATKGSSSLVMCNALGDDETGLEVIADRSYSAAFFICDAFNMTQARARAPTIHAPRHTHSVPTCIHACILTTD